MNIDVRPLTYHQYLHRTTLLTEPLAEVCILGSKSPYSTLRSRYPVTTTPVAWLIVGGAAITIRPTVYLRRFT